MQARTLNVLKYGWKKRQYDPLAWKRARAHPHRHMAMVSRFIRSLRKRLSLTQKELAERVGVGVSTVYLWEKRDGAMPRAYQWRRLRELWGVTKAMKEDGFWKNRTRRPEL